MKKIIPEGMKLWLQEGPCNFNFVFYPGCSASVILSKQSELYFNYVITRGKDKLFLYGYDEDELYDLGKRYFKLQSKDPDYTKKLVEKWKNYEKTFYDICKKIDQTNLDEIPDKELADLYKQFSDAYLDEYALPLLTDAVGFYCEIELPKTFKKFLEGIDQENKLSKDLTILTMPTTETFVNKEKNELLDIAKKIGKDLIKKNTETIISSLPDDINKELDEHVKKYFWIQNNYLRAVILKKDYFIDRIKEHIENPETINKIQPKQELIKELDLSDELKLFITLIDEHAAWQDLRKKANLIADHYLSLFLKELSTRKELDFDDLHYTTMDEVTDLILDKPVDMDKVRLRKKNASYIFTPDKITVLEYEDCKILDKEIDEQFKTKDTGEITGAIANTGKVTGKVKIIIGPHEFDNLERGDILVTSMTRPEFVPILSRAAAIVTDEGGLTCHAAIVSRELGIPCIVGTKVGTKVLKNNDIVEVDADKGIVTKK